MKRIRRRPNRTGSGMKHMRRSVSHPPVRPGPGGEQVKPLLGVGDTNSVQSDDLEAGASTGDSYATGMSDDPWDDSKKTHTKPLSPATICSRLQTMCSTIPTPLKTVLVLHTVACFYSLYCIYFYLRFYAGFYTALLLSTVMAFIFVLSAYTALLTFRSATAELQTVLDQEGRSRAILNTLYPPKVLEQMVQELQPCQIEQAQQQQLQMRTNGSGIAVGTTSTPPDSPTRSMPLSRTLSGRNMARRNSMKRHSSFRKQLSFERKEENGTTNAVVVTVDRNSLGYDDNNNNNNNNGSNTTAITAQEEDSIVVEVPVLRRNSLNVRRQSMSRRHSQTQSSATTAAFRRLSMNLSSHGATTTRRMSGGSVSSTASSTGRPIQERFSNTTVLFADIAGFTKWCSEREPCHVFHLLESVFFAFDNLAKSLGVYKIETIGDCYVAVTGIPQAMESHASAMALFASQIILEFDLVAEDLASEAEEEGGLGPDTRNLKLRAGCHSGAVTAGVLRGDKGRFQLFGDTVNTAARMESNGSPGKVQISQEMADCLDNEGKADWYRLRQDQIEAKGKGKLTTYWLNYDLVGQLKLDQINKENKVTTPTISNIKPNPLASPILKADTPPSQPQRKMQLLPQDETPLKQNAQKQKRASEQFQETSSMWIKLERDLSAPEQKLAEWNFHQLELLVKKIKAHYTASQMDASNLSIMMEDWGEESEGLHYEEFDGSILEELRQTNENNLIPTGTKTTVNHAGMMLQAPVVLELQAFCKALVANFQKQPFHNFAHACHMTRSMVQLLEHLELQNADGILAKDPMAQFVIVLTCIVQDVDNPGVTNDQLMKEDSDMAEYFHNTCLTQQNALDVAWELLVGPTCENLLQAICSHSAMELERFRKYMLHGMLATDREDKDLAQERFVRWKKVTNPNASYRQSKATWHKSVAAIEQCTQLSSLIHTVQTPEIFAKWNERCFREQYLAYIKGRQDRDPCEIFYDEQLELLKRSVIPLAERFHRCRYNGVMGSCDELSLQATANLERWKTCGPDEVQKMASDAKYEFGERQPDGPIKLGEEA